MTAFKGIHFSAASRAGDEHQSPLEGAGIDAIGTPGLAAAASPDEALDQALESLANRSDESASRIQLQAYLERTDDDWMTAITAPGRSEAVPDMRLRAVAPVSPLAANNVVFQQSANAIPIFGARVSVDIDAADKSLIAINGKVVPVPDASPIATISPAEALERLIAWGGPGEESAADVRAAAAGPGLSWYLDEDLQRWHLTYHFQALPMAPAAGPSDGEDPFPQLAHTCLGESPRSSYPLYDYFVDAHDGAVVFSFSATPHFDQPGPPPVKMNGLDCDGRAQTFLGMLGGEGGFVLYDPVRNIETYDYGGGDLDARPLPPLPPTPMTFGSADLGNADPAAVSAHYHALRVFDFYNSVLKRDGIDDKGMKLVSVINAYSSRSRMQPPEWPNAVWWQGKMWYGQAGGVSFARYLDVIAHELTHGVTASSSNLIYRGIPGALNESFSDFFGVAVANWEPEAPRPTANWNWEIGAGLGGNGLPIRDFSNPARTGQPEHWSQYQPLPQRYDEGGVHVYSGIHNKALYHLLTDRDAAGELAFPTDDAVLLVYLTLTRLTPTSDFSDSRRTLESLASVYYTGSPQLPDRLAAIAAAFAQVGL